MTAMRQAVLQQVLIPWLHLAGKLNCVHVAAAEMAGPDIAPLHSTTSLLPIRPPVRLPSRTLRPAVTLLRAWMIPADQYPQLPLAARIQWCRPTPWEKAPTGTVASTFTGTAQGGGSIPPRTTQPTIVMNFVING